MELHDHGLASDLEMMRQQAAERRQVLRWLLAGAATLPLMSCGGGSDASSTGSSSAAAGSAGTVTIPTTGACTVIPEETGGPYPADGTNTSGGSIINVLNQSGVVRSDIRASFNGATGMAAGVPLTINLQLLNASGNCASLAGYAVYLWHCDREGLYSLYSSGVTAQNYLRGVQETDSAGNLSFTTIFPGCYAGRMPHVHFEVYPSLAKAASAANRIKTSQFTFPMATLSEAYTASGYTASVRNLSQISYATDNVFSDGTSLQMATVTGNATQGYVVTLIVAVNG
ncbi:intradiol ring-cleavage dioxygenase [Janthinobacterium lividum]|uniref:dioxygenase family protein n=1 Tax=Janthinobacterium lividum TaxID=29581 RepID=UPI000874C20C|nr:intradiol ring-cleavage dioxygenase [Janthinobacterium lividum]MCC7712449.1 intradiol ring-cleavage dioxygenase [Janthinobacterium lividum]OEZ62400.1 dioxygenase [Janthinobacterium lividum]WQE26880.1 intradiol ring-cleavage dioxygenase [Janthinobacterium lividum]STQ97764.1 Protocatechuate 3,4-dioxygenase beta subunit [Janthinobacterium lividum]